MILETTYVIKSYLQAMPVLTEILNNKDDLMSVFQVTGVSYIIFENTLKESRLYSLSSTVYKIICRYKSV